MFEMGDHYPESWDRFIGQDAAKWQLKVAAQSAAKRGKRMGHVLLACPAAGMGKTALALLIAQELGGDVHTVTEQLTPQELPFLLMDASDGDVLFLDEVHKQAAGNKRKAEWMLNLLENGMMPGPMGAEKAPDITVVAATTDPTLLPFAVRERFEHKPTLMPYTDGEGRLLAQQLGSKVLVPEGMPVPGDAAAAAIAVAANNVPRRIRMILCHVRDLVAVDEITTMGGDYELDKAFLMAGVTPDGLTSEASKYLTILFKEFRGVPAGQATMADRLGDDLAGVKEVERLLLDKGLITLTGRGRALTPDGRQRARRLAA